jgi:serine/threonine-protein kinase
MVRSRRQTTMYSIPQPFAPGSIVESRYRIEAPLGEGGMGVVFRATQLNLDRPVALKVMLAEGLGDEALQRFLREAEIVQRLEHPNIVRLLDFGHAGPAGAATPFLVFELLQGRTLHELLRDEGALPPPRAARITIQVLKALMEAHARSVVHRDIKPGNVFVCNFQGEPDFVKVLDFGIAKGSDSRAVTQSGGVIGTPAYMAPEQVDQRGEVGFAADLYALGITLEEMVTGRPVFPDASLIDIVREHGSATPIAHAPEALKSPLGPVIHRATQKLVERRYPSAAEMLAHVEAVVAYGMPGVTSVPGSALPSPAAMIGYAPTAVRGAAEGEPSQALLGASPPYAPALVPALAPAPRAAKKRRRPWAILAAVGASVACLAGALVLVLTLGRDERPRKDAEVATDASTDAAVQSAGLPLRWVDFRAHLALAEVDANGDRVPDVLGLCQVDLAHSGALSLCLVDGASFRLQWTQPVASEASETRFAVIGTRAVIVDPLGVVHLHDIATGAELGTVRFGGRVDHVCTPPDMPGKIWIRTRDKRGVLVDLAARTVSDLSRPASCPMGRDELGCFTAKDPRVCPPERTRPEINGVHIDDTIVDGSIGFAWGERFSDLSVPLLFGFVPRASGTPTVKWQRTVTPGDGLGAVGRTSGAEVDLAGGRAVIGYRGATGAAHALVVDAATGTTVWDKEIPGNLMALTLTPSRLFAQLIMKIEVRDAATGAVIGVLPETK